MQFTAKNKDGRNHFSQSIWQLFPKKEGKSHPIWCDAKIEFVTINNDLLYTNICARYAVHSILIPLTRYTFAGRHRERAKTLAPKRHMNVRCKPLDVGEKNRTGICTLSSVLFLFAISFVSRLIREGFKGLRQTNLLRSCLQKHGEILLLLNAKINRCENYSGQIHFMWWQTNGKNEYKRQQQQSVITAVCTWHILLIFHSIQHMQLSRFTCSEHRVGPVDFHIAFSVHACIRCSALFSQFISRSFWRYAFVNFLLVTSTNV